MVSYEEFVPLCFEMLTEILKSELLDEKRTPTELETFLLEMFAEMRRNEQPTCFGNVPIRLLIR